MKMLKRFTAAAAAVLMLAAGMVPGAHASASEAVEDYVVSTFDQGIMIEKYNGSEAQVVIPSQMTLPSSGQTLDVFAIGDNAFASNLSVTSVTIPDTVKFIGQEAFSNCQNIVSVTFGNSVEGIGVSAFSSCSSIEHILLPDSLNLLGAAAFEYCYSLKTVHTGDGIETLTSYSFSRCGSLYKVTLGNNVTTIQKDAFLGSNEIEEVWFNEKAQNFSMDSFGSGFSGKIYCYYDSFAEQFAHDNNIEHEYYEISGITLEGPDKTVYLEGEAVSIEGLKVTARYNNAPSRNIDLSKCHIDTEYEDDEGRSIEVIYTEGTKSFYKYAHISFIEDVVTGIEITKLPDTLLYRYRYRRGVSLSGIELEVTYESGKRETVTDTSLMTVTGFNNTKRGVQTLTVSYEGQKAEYQVTVRALWWQWILLIVCFGWIWYR